MACPANALRPLSLLYALHQMSNSSTYLIRFRTSCGSGGFGRRCSHIATMPATIIEVTMTNPAAITPATITNVDFRSFSSLVDVSAGFGSSTEPTSPIIILNRSVCGHCLFYGSPIQRYVLLLSFNGAKSDCLIKN